MTEIALTETVPEIPTWLNYRASLDDLMWMEAWQYDPHSGVLTIEGIIKPDLSLKSAPELRAGFMVSFNKIIYTLELARACFQDHPELKITGKAHYILSPEGYPNFGDLKAEITIRLIG